MDSFRGDIVKASHIGRQLKRQFELPFSGSFFFFFVGLFPISLSIVYLLGRTWNLHFLTEIFFLFFIPKLTKDLLEGSGRLGGIEDLFSGLSPAVTFYVFHFCLYQFLQEGYRTVTLEQLNIFLFTFYPAALFSQKHLFCRFFKQVSLGAEESEAFSQDFEEKYRDRVKQQQQAEFWRLRNKEKQRKKKGQEQKSSDQTNREFEKPKQGPEPKPKHSGPRKSTISERRNNIFKENDIMLGDRKYTNSEVFIFFLLEPDSSKEELKKAYRSFLKQNHPDFISGIDSTSEKLLFAKRKTELAIKLFRQVS